MARDNNGVKAKVTTNVGQGSAERGGGMVGVTVDMSHVKDLIPQFQLTL